MRVPSRDSRFRWPRSTPRWHPPGPLVAETLRPWSKLEGVVRRQCGVKAMGEVPNPNRDGRSFRHEAPRANKGHVRGFSKEPPQWRKRSDSSLGGCRTVKLTPKDQERGPAKPLGCPITYPIQDQYFLLQNLASRRLEEPGSFSRWSASGFSVWQFGDRHLNGPNSLIVCFASGLFPKSANGQRDGSGATAASQPFFWPPTIPKTHLPQRPHIRGVYCVPPTTT